jgi:DNA-binding transcriptional MocR family regulator
MIGFTTLGLTPWHEPRPGMFVWCSLPKVIEAADIARRALAANIVLALGNAFSLARTAKCFLRFNVAQSGNERIFKVLATAMQG